MVSRNDIISQARKYIGAPYLHQGRNKNGIDCVGLLIRVAHDLYISDYDIRDYSDVPSGRFMRLELQRILIKKELVEAMIADVLHICYEYEPQHLAFVSSVSPMRIIHSDSMARSKEYVNGRVVESYVSDLKIRGIYSIPGVI